jgi:hypothetical protein
MSRAVYKKRAIPMGLARYLKQKRCNFSFDFDFTMSVISTSPEAREIYLNKNQHEKLNIPWTREDKVNY